MLCDKCGQEQGVRCPCQRSECSLVTVYAACAACEPERVAKLQKMRGQEVCSWYVEQQMGLR